MGVSCTSAARIHRLGKSSEGKPIIMYFQDYVEKHSVMQNARKLKGTNISIQGDYCADTRRKRKLLWNSAKADKDSGKKVQLIHDKLRIDDQYFSWDDASNSRKKISATDSSRRRKQKFVTNCSATES